MVVCIVPNMSFGTQLMSRAIANINLWFCEWAKREVSKTQSHSIFSEKETLEKLFPFWTLLSTVLSYTFNFLSYCSQSLVLFIISLKCKYFQQRKTVTSTHWLFKVLQRLTSFTKHCGFDSLTEETMSLFFVTVFFTDFK